RPEALVVLIHFAAGEELIQVEPRKGGIRKRVRELAEVLVPQAQRQSECGCDLPVVLEKVGLMELIGVKDLRAENSVGRSGGSTEVVQEIGKCGIAHGVVKGEGPQITGAPLLGDQLPQELYTVAERVAAAQLGLRLLKEKVVAVVELGVCGVQARR